MQHQVDSLINFWIQWYHHAAIKTTTPPVIVFGDSVTVKCSRTNLNWICNETTAQWHALRTQVSKLEITWLFVKGQHANDGTHRACRMPSVYTADRELDTATTDTGWAAIQGKWVTRWTYTGCTSLHAPLTSHHQITS